MKPRILIVDDDDEILGNYFDLLSELGYVISAHNEPNTVMESFKKDTYDLVILDISMNGDRESGFKLCRRIRSEDNQVRIVMNTALDDINNRSMAFSLGANEFWNKKMSLQSFLSKVAKLTQPKGV